MLTNCNHFVIILFSIKTTINQTLQVLLPNKTSSFDPFPGLHGSRGGGVWRPRPLGSPAKYLAGMGVSSSSRGLPVPQAVKDEMYDYRDHHRPGEALSDDLTAFELVLCSSEIPLSHLTLSLIITTSSAVSAPGYKSLMGQPR